MDLLNSLRQVSAAERLIQLERLDKNEVISGDFEGNVKGIWVKLDEDGTGIVSFNDKKYHTKPLGITSITQGTEVELSFANGIYYSKY